MITGLVFAEIRPLPKTILIMLLINRAVSLWKRNALFWMKGMWISWPRF